LSSAKSPLRAFTIPLLAVVLLSLSILVPGALFAWMAWQNHVQAMQEGQLIAERTVGAMHEHALRALETSELLLRHLDRQIEGSTWDEVEANARLHTDVAQLARAMGSIVSIAFFDADGRVRLHSHGLHGADPAIVTSDHFQALREGSSDLVIGSARVGPVTGERLFPMSLRRSGRDGRFDGILTIGVSLRYFTDFWRQFAPTVAHVIPLMREDGELLVRYPALNNPVRLRPDGPFMQQIALAPSGVYTAVSLVDGIERTNAYTRIGSFPLYVSFSIETRALAKAWRQSLITPGWLTALVICILLVLSILLIRYVAREQQAVAKWRDAARRLGAEMDRREAAESNLRQAQKIETIGQITGGVAHDFNNLLQVLSNNLQLAARVARDSAAMPFITAAMSAADRGAKLTHQLLAFSRRQPLSPQPVDVRSMLDEIAALTRTTVGATVQVSIVTRDDVWPAMADRNQAEMAILNLAINARDAMPAGGTLEIAGSNAHVDEQQAGELGLEPGEYVVIAVSDTGSGMSRETAQRAFEPFFTTKESGKGSGLGLSQVHGFAAQSGGAVKIDSRIEEGTTVQLYLPRANSGAPARSKVREVQLRFRGQVVLLVDDDAEVRKGIASELVVLGHTVIEAQSGAEAVDKLRNGSEITLLITDYAMPTMRGNVLAAEATKIRPDLPVILISGFADLPDDESLQWDLLRKPFSSSELETCISEALQRPARYVRSTTS
jgi:signal transduction histidine kinase